jgi:cellulose synthase/poly-beta-1,6-N-acetylglucosamine synthase-like glycosyltransferase
VHVERVAGGWRLWFPASCTDERAKLDAVARPSPDVLAFRVANGHLPATGEAAAELQLADGEPFIEREARRLGLDESTSLEWADGERALIFEMEVPRNQARRLRVSGPSGLAWALFEPGADGDWRPRATASAVGFAAGTSQVKLRPGVWALVLFHDSASVPTGPVEIAFDGEDAKAVPAFLADAHELRRFVLGTLALAVILSLGEAGRVYLMTGNIWSTWVAWPIGAMFLLFPASFAVNTLWHCFHNMRILRGEQAYRSAIFANRPLEIERTTWPSVTIQIPIFREPFDAVIRPTLESARKAAERYREKTGARCNVLVCDDGLLCFAGNDLEGALADARSTPPHARSTAQSELVARIAYYEDADVAFVARPWPQPGVPGTARAGRFRKASNLNYSLRLADRLEPSEPLSEAHARFRTTLSERAYALGVSGGDVHVGEFIVQLDKDSMMPPDVIQATVPEFLADPTLAYTQHSTYPTNEDRYFSAMIGWFTRLLFDLAIRSKCLIAGSMVPMLGHNLFLRRADLLREGGWHEHSVCEDLEMMMRFHVGGRHGKYICYPGQDFGEAVTRVYTEELERFRRYAFGAAEAVINPITEWERRGIIKESWRRFCRSEHVRWYQVLDLLQFFFSLINIASIVPFAVITGLGIVHPYTALVMGLISLAIFSVVTIPAIYLLRRRGGLAAMPANRIWRSRFGAWKAVFLQFLVGISFIGCSLAVMSGALAHLFNRPLVFAETSVDELGQLSRRAHLRNGAMRQAARDAALLFAIGTVLAAWQFYLNSLPLPVGAEPLDWRYHAVWLYPLVLTAIAPFVFHPYLIGGPDLPRWLAQRRERGASHPPVVPKIHNEQAASRRQGVS